MCIRDSKKCVARDPENSEAWFALGRAYYGQNGMKTCEASYEPWTRCIALDPKHATAHNNLGNVLKDVRKDYDGAEAHYRKAIELDPRQTLALGNLSIILEHQKNDVAGAVELMEEVVRLGGIPSFDGEQRLATLRRKLARNP